MSRTAKHLSEGYHSITPYIIVDGAASAIAFYQTAFGATELMRLTDDAGRVRHAEIRIGDSVLMLVDEGNPPSLPFMHSAHSLGGSPAELFLYVDDVDAVMKQALAAGAREVLPVADAGEDRRGGVMDPFGLVWWIATRIQDISREEIRRQFEAELKRAGR